LCATGLDRAIVAAFVWGKLWTYDVHADVGLQNDLLDIGEKFWKRVEAHDPPPLEAPGDARIFGRLVDQKSKQLVVPASVDEAADLCRQYRQLRAEAKQAAEKAEMVKGRIVPLIGDSAGLDLGENGPKVTFRRTKDGSAVDWKGVALQIAVCTNTSREALDQVVKDCTITKSGYRRFVVKIGDEGEEE
jgi:hypothetical protein